MSQSGCCCWAVGILTFAYQVTCTRCSGRRAAIRAFGPDPSPVFDAGLLRAFDRARARRRADEQQIADVVAEMAPCSRWRGALALAGTLLLAIGGRRWSKATRGSARSFGSCDSAAYWAAGDDRLVLRPGVRLALVQNLAPSGAVAFVLAGSRGRARVGLRANWHPALSGAALRDAGRTASDGAGDFAARRPWPSGQLVESASAVSLATVMRDDPWKSFCSKKSITSVASATSFA